LTEKDVFNPQKFIREQVSEIKKVLGEERAIIACSGGVDSTTCALLTRKAVGRNLICVFIDTNFMRLNEPTEVVKTLSSPPIELPVKLILSQKRFMEALRGLEDAEEKRKAFRNTFYSVLREVAEEEKSQFLVQGTILADIIETVKGIKTQHNVLEQMKIDTREVYGFKLIEPLVSLNKFQVREVARCLGIPLDSSERQPFPGPGLSVRVVGKITQSKLDVEKIANEIVEKNLKKLQPKQYFSATLDSETEGYSKSGEIENEIAELLKGKEFSVKVQSLTTKATGIRGGSRLYGKVITVSVKDKKGKSVELNRSSLEKIQNIVIKNDANVSRVLYQITDTVKRGMWLIAVRSVETVDFITASISEIPMHNLKEMNEQILKSCKDVSAVYYDITPKPPASIEFE